MESGEKEPWRDRWERERSTNSDGTPIVDQPRWLLYRRYDSTKIVNNHFEIAVIPISILIHFYVLFEVIWHGMWGYFGVLFAGVLLVVVVESFTAQDSVASLLTQFLMSCCVLIYYWSTRKEAIKRSLRRKGWEVIGVSNARWKKDAKKEWRNAGLLR